MKKNNKKGFTLVELLVVIAVLAILATVSVVGYTGFTKKAQQSNAQTELTQARELIRAEVLTADKDGLKVCDHVNIKTSDSGTGYTLTVSSDNNFDADLKAKFTDLESLKGTFAVTSTTITYTLSGAVATWTLNTDVITVA